MAIDLEHFPTSPSAKRMIASVSEEFYEKSYVGKWLYQVLGLEWDVVRQIIETLPEQAFPETATWGLMYHEMKWGLPVRENLDYEERRRRIYHRRDMRAPMNPWRMEWYLQNATGYNFHIEDINDAHIYGWTPTHPNIFHVYILNADGTANTQLVRAKLDTLCQSHTNYLLDERVHFRPFVNEPDDLLLKRFTQSSAFTNYRSKIHPAFDGAILFDGSALFDTVAESLFHFPRFVQNVVTPGIRDSPDMSAFRQRYWLREFPARFGGREYFDGAALFDGSAAFDSPVGGMIRFPLLRILFPGFSNRRGITPHLFDGAIPFDGSTDFGVTTSLFHFPRLWMRGTLGGTADRLFPVSFRQRFRLPEFPGAAARRLDGSAIFDGSARFDQQDGGMLWLPHFRVAGTSFSNRRGIVPHPFDGTTLFDGESSFGVTASQFHFPRFRQRSGAGVHANRLGHAALISDSLWSFDGSAGFDGALRFNADITKEEL